MINFTVIDQEVNGENGWPILEVAQGHSIDIPTLCHHGAVEPARACRICMVEVHDDRRSLVEPSGLYPIGEDIAVANDSDGVKNVRHWVLQKWMNQYSGSERLLALAKTYGVTSSRFKSSDYEVSTSYHEQSGVHRLRDLSVRLPHRSHGTIL